MYVHIHVQVHSNMMCDFIYSRNFSPPKLFFIFNFIFNFASSNLYSVEFRAWGRGEVMFSTDGW